MLVIRWRSAVLLLSIVSSPALLEAQAPFNACVDRTGAPIPSKTDTKIGYAGLAGYDDGKPMIWWNAKYLDNASEPEQLLVYLHECAHHSLGHLWEDTGARQSIEAEQEADCWAIQLMADGGMVRKTAVDSLIAAQVNRRGDGEHLGGEDLVRALHRCLDIRTDADAWAAALPPLIEAGRNHFTGIRGRELESASGRDSVWESQLDLPGTYDCEVMGTKRVRCIVFVSRYQSPAASRYKKLVKLLTEWAPASWSLVENPTPAAPLAKAFHAQDPASGMTLSLLLGNDPKIYFVVTAPKS